MFIFNRGMTERLLAVVLSGVSVASVNAATIIGATGAYNGIGEDGGDGETAISTSLDPSNTAIGGYGGAGGMDDESGAGAGGNGGDAMAAASQSATAQAGDGGPAGYAFSDPRMGGMGGDAYATAAGTGSVSAVATGGMGGASSPGGWLGFYWGNGADGGYATASADATATSSSGASAEATATGGDGWGGYGGNGGLAAASATASSVYGGPVTAVATQVGGKGNSGGSVLDPGTGEITGTAAHGLSMDSNMINFVSGFSQAPQGFPAGTVSLGQIAKGAQAPHGDYSFNAPGVAGNATSTLNHWSTHGEASYYAETEARGGTGGSSFGTAIATPGGQATASTTLQADSQFSSDTSMYAKAEAYGTSGGSNTTIDGDSGIGGQGGSATANAYAEAIDGDATAVASAQGGAGGSATSGQNGTAGIGGSANAEATAVTVTGSASAAATGVGGAGGSGGIGGGALGGVASALATAQAGGLSVSVYDAASNGGTAEAAISLTAPVNGVATIPTIGGSPPEQPTVARICIDSDTDTTVSYSGTLTLAGPNGAQIKSANADHTLSATSIVFASDITITVTDMIDSLTLDGPTTFTAACNNFTKAGPGELIFDDDMDITGTDLQVMMESDTFSSSDPQISVDGDVDIDGVLNLDLVGAFEPSIGDDFDLIAYSGTLTGKFDTVEFPSVDGLSFGVLYGTGVISVHVELEGDLNGDGFVGISDLSIVLGSWNASVDAGVLLQGDPSGDGFVGIEDENIVLGNWGAGTPPVAGASVPEPGSLVLCSMLGLVMLRRSGY